MSLPKRLFAEFIGTFWLVLAGCGSAVLAAKFPDLGIGFLGVAFAFGLSVLTMIYAVGHISGAHFNPAVSWGLFVGKRFGCKDLLPYIIIQVIAATAAAYLLYLIASGDPSFNISGGLANNGYGDHSPGGYTLLSCFLAEVTMTFMFIMVILGSTDESAPKGFAGISIGLCLTLVNLVAIPITNASINPARTMGPALVVGGWAIDQLWLFWVAPLVGATLAGLAYRCLKSNR